MREHAIHDVVEPACFPLEGVISRIWSDCPATEVDGHELQDLISVSILADRNARSHFPSDPDFGSRSDRDGEASFSVEVTGDVRRDVDRVARARVLRRS
jgi:hypothetical protein